MRRCRACDQSFGRKYLLDVVAVGLEQHVGAAELTNLLLRPLDHAVALAALGVQHLAGGGDFEALFGARLGLQLGHLALLKPACRQSRERVSGRQMLVRALKLRDYFENETVGMAAATAALVQPGGEGRPYDRRTGKWQRSASF